MRKNKIRGTMFVFFLTLAILVLCFMVFIKTSPTPSPAKILLNGNFSDFYDSYLSTKPDLDELPCYGAQNAPLILVEYSRPNSNASIDFLANDFPVLESEYIKTGKLKFCHKDHISLGEYDEKGDTFIYAVSLSCVQQMKPSNYFSFYFMLHNTSSAKEINKTASAANISVRELDDCMKNGDNGKIKQSAIEVERFGMTGVIPRFYLSMNGFDTTIINGVPSQTDLRRAIKRYGVILGD